MGMLDKDADGVECYDFFGKKINNGDYVFGGAYYGSRKSINVDLYVVKQILSTSLLLQSVGYGYLHRKAIPSPKGTVFSLIKLSEDQIEKLNK